MTSRRLGGVPRGVVPVVALMATCSALTAGWFATGHASAPDDGLLQLDVLSYDEPVAGLAAVDGRPTMAVLRCSPAVRHALDPAYGFLVSTDPDLARRVALPGALDCAGDQQDGYVLLDGAGRVRYRSYDPGWADHAEEQEVLLGHLAQHGRGHGA